MLRVFDAMAGVVAVAVFVAGVIASGGLVSADAARTLLGVATLCFPAPLIAGTARPLRRPRAMTFEEHFDRTADIVIASLVGAWAVRTIIQGLPGLSGFQLPIAERAGAVALLVLAALIVRMLIGTVPAHWYPRRLARVQPADLGEPTLGTLVLGRLEEGRQLIRYSFVLLSLPGAIVAVLELLGGEGPEREFKWQHQVVLGIPVVALGVLLALGLIG